MTDVGEQATARERPLGVVVISLFLLVDAALTIGQVVLDTDLSTRVDTLIEINAWMPAIVVGLSVAKALAAVGMWLGYRWAWVLAMLSVGANLLLAFYVYWVGDPAYAPMALNVVMAFYLNQGAVRVYFERGSQTDAAEPVGR